MERINVKTVLMAFMTIVILVFTAGCEDDPIDKDMTRTQSIETVAKPKVPGLDFLFDWDVNNYTTWLETPWTIKESVTGLNDGDETKAWVSHKEDRFAVADTYRNVSLQYTQEHTTKSQDYTKTLSSSTTRKEFQDSTRWTAMIEDGNLCYLDVVVKRLQMEVRDTMRILPYIKVNNAKVIRIESLPGTTAMTRGTYVSDSIVRRVTWQLDCEVVGGDILDRNSTFNQELQDMYKVLLLSEDEIDRAYSRDKNRVVIDDNTERCSFVEVFVMKSKETHEQPQNIILNRELKGIPEYLKTVESFNYVWKKDNAISLGAVKNGIRTEGNWTVDGRTDSFGALVDNDKNESITTSYTFYHEGATYKDKWLTEEFELITPNMTEKQTHVELIETTDPNYDQARLFNDINTMYLNYPQTCGETVKLQKRAVTIKWEGWESLDGTRTVFNDSIVWIPVYKIEYTDGNIIRTPFRNSDDRSLDPLTKWMSIEQNNNQNTGDVTIGNPSRRDMSRTVNGAVFTWTRETRTLNNYARLAGSTQENQWRSVEPVGMTVTYRGKSITWTDLTISTTNTASVTGGAVVDGYHVYDYSDALSYRYGNNTKVVPAPGIIKVLAEGIESEGWDASSAKEVWSDNRVDWSLDWVVKYTTGREDRTNFAWNAPRSYKVTTSWNSIEKSATYGTSNETVSVTASSNESKNVNGAVFEWVKETRSIKTVATLDASVQNNGWEAIDPMACKVTRNGKVFEFGRKNVTTNDRDYLTGGEKQGDYKVYNYGDDMSYSIGGNTKMLTAPGIIRVKEEIPNTITSEGFENASKVVTDSLVKWHIEYVTKWSNGNTDRETFDCMASRSLHQTTNWTSEEANNNQTTTGATGSVTNTSAQSKNVNGAVFSWTREVRSIKSVAKLNGSNQNNGWEAVDPNGCVVTYKGKSYNFGTDNVNMNNTATVTGGNESNGYKVYTYRDKLAYTFGSNTKYSQAPGTIKVKVSAPVEPTFFPEKCGAVTAFKQTVANTPNHKGWLYTWLIEFENGYCLPVPIESGSTSPQWNNFKWLEKTSVKSYNGGTYEAATGNWICTTAQDQPNHMIWARNGVERANKNYSEAKQQNWDEGRLVNGKPSVNTNRYSHTISNGKLTVKDTYTGVTIGSWTYYTGK